MITCALADQQAADGAAASGTQRAAAARNIKLPLIPALFSARPMIITRTRPQARAFVADSAPQNAPDGLEQKKSFALGQ
jgi:hypothetical protein